LRRSSAKKLCHAMSEAADSLRSSVAPGYCAATGAAGRSYLGIIVQPDNARAAAKMDSWVFDMTEFKTRNDIVMTMKTQSRLQNCHGRNDVHFLHYAVVMRWSEVLSCL